MSTVASQPISLSDVKNAITTQGAGASTPLPLGDERLVKAALVLATLLQKRAATLQTPQERRQQAELDRMLQHPEDKATLTQITDQSFRSDTPGRVVNQMVHILDVQGVPRFFSVFDQALLKGFQSFGEYLPGVAVPMVKEKMRKETANVILPAESDKLTSHLRERSSEGLRMNVNFLGEAILGEKESRKRLDRYLAALQLPEIECVSAKISTLYSQISPIARKQTIRTVSDRLELLYRAAAKEKFKKRDGTLVPKFVYLDMEEYRDLHLTAEIFMKTLSRPGMENVRAGIALQAYVPDSALVQETITAWARERVAAGGSPITVRIVKGANMEMERVEASIRGWPQAPYKSKIDTDANYKRMLQFGLRDENIKAVHLGIASHNLFDLAYGMVLATSQNALDKVQFEMLEGMANHQRRALFELSGSVLLYAPACLKEEFINAIGYLVRRLDENTGPDNFLRHAFHISAGGSTWQRLENGFIEAVHRADTVSVQPRRQQDRNQTPAQPPAPNRWQEFICEPDTDFSLVQNSKWAEGIIKSWEPRCDSNAMQIPVVIAGQEVVGGGSEYVSLDPSRPGVAVAKYRQADENQLKAAMDSAAADVSGWTKMTPESRYQILRQVAHEIRIARGDLMGAALADGGKTLMESDPEVSEAVDFVEFYARCALDMSHDQRFKARGAGPVVVISPWNFPIAIPCGGIAAALAAGNTVLLKPASDTALPAYVLCQCFWRAGVPREALQFVPSSGSLTSRHLLSRPEVSRVILTGGTETALNILNQRPSLRLFAETGGKNATIVSGLSDRDLAIKNVLHSAFSHAGQKCSATSLLLLDEEVFESKEFKEQLVDAVESLKVGSAWDLATKMGPVIRPPSGDLLRGLKELERGETWAVMPGQIGDNPCQYTPGVKWNTQPNSFTHLTELFGPVLGVMKYRKLSEAIQMVNATGYGLTSGLESLDDREQAVWRNSIMAGNLYINRPTTGAIVLRQPFGGMGKSAFGSGAKAGGPNYVATLMDFEDNNAAIAEPHTPSFSSPEIQSLWNRLERASRVLMELPNSSPDDLKKLRAAMVSYDEFAASEIKKEHDHFKLIGQDNHRRYLPASPIRVRITATDSVFSIVARALAAVVSGCRCVMSRDEGVHEATIDALENLTLDWAGKIEFLVETDEELIDAVRQDFVKRVRYDAGASIPEPVHRICNEHQVYIADRYVSTVGAIELPLYVVEQSISFDYHRYGNLGVRTGEQRADIM
ncbi:MAG: bifunctional proline dehydrogenase/L-glutamate gamma-semialdehyde dehydrogenase [Pirellula sp.]|nr:bifunctional proline dehydrogenase/L-glutamate gamma-semialdehyde dehydrogenase [Pirellula sp.]